MPTPSLALIIKQSVNWKTTHTEILRTGLEKKKHIRLKSSNWITKTIPAAIGKFFLCCSIFCFLPKKKYQTIEQKGVHLHSNIPTKERIF